MSDLEKIVAINRQRIGLDPLDVEADQAFSTNMGAHERLCVYGTLRTGEENHHLMEPLNGQWHDVTYPGYFSAPDDSYDYPRIAWTPAGDINPGELVISDKLPRHWAALDDFEGEDYCRLLTIVQASSGPMIANIYGFISSTRTHLLMMDGMNVHDDKD